MPLYRNHSHTFPVGTHVLTVKHALTNMTRLPRWMLPDEILLLQRPDAERRRRNRGTGGQSCRSRRWKDEVRLVTVLVLFLGTIPPAVQSFSALPSPSSSSSSSSSFTNPPSVPLPTMNVQSFRLAPNGVCLHPKFFQAVSEKRQQQQQSQQTMVRNDTRVKDDHQSSSNEQIFTMINVPGDGDCMFLAVALAATYSMGLTSLVLGRKSIDETTKGGLLDSTPNASFLQAIALDTRRMVAQVLGSPDGYLYISNKKNTPAGGRTTTTTTSTQNKNKKKQSVTTKPTSTAIVCKASDLLQQATRQELGMNTTQDYLDALVTPGIQGGLYGGGPELTVLSNILRRPISVYELARTTTRTATGGRNVSSSSTTSSQEQSSSEHSEDPKPSTTTTCPIVCKGTFGDGIFEDPCQKMDILPQSAVIYSLSSSSSSFIGARPATLNWHLHILILDVTPTEKHACVLIPTEIISE